VNGRLLNSFPALYFLDNRLTSKQSNLKIVTDICLYFSNPIESLIREFTYRNTMFTKKKKKPLISTPTNFQHRVHTGYDRREGRYVGLPLQWASIVGNNQILKSTNRPIPLVDPSEITPTEILDLKVWFNIF
jgi:hypothetical protein